MSDDTLNVRKAICQAAATRTRYSYEEIEEVTRFLDSIDLTLAAIIMADTRNISLQGAAQLIKDEEGE